MPCKHEGGADPCVQFPKGGCRVYHRNRGREYERTVRMSNRAGVGTCSDLGQACEYFVAADLLRRGLLVTKPLNTNGKHDLHAKCGSRWVTFQVKAARVNVKTGTLSAPGSALKNSSREKYNVRSDVLVVVDLTGRRLRYLPFNIPELPEELRDAIV